MIWTGQQGLRREAFRLDKEGQIADLIAECEMNYPGSSGRIDFHLKTIERRDMNPNRNKSCPSVENMLNIHRHSSSSSSTISHGFLIYFNEKVVDNEKVEVDDVLDGGCGVWPRPRVGVGM